MWCVDGDMVMVDVALWHLLFNVQKWVAELPNKWVRCVMFLQLGISGCCHFTNGL